MNVEKFRKHLVDIDFQKDDRDVIFKFDDGSKKSYQISEDDRLSIDDKEYSLQETWDIQENNRFRALGKQIYISDVKLKTGERFEKCVFLELISLVNSDHEFYIHFKDCIFVSPIDFSLQILKEQVSFENCIFLEELFFNKTLFNKIVTFERCIFKKPMNFYQTNFMGTVSFTGAVFKEPVIFQYVKLYKNMILRETTFEKSLNLAYMTFMESGFLEPYKVDIKPFKAGTDIDYDKGRSWSDEECLDTRNVISNEDAQETYRILKKESIKQSDTINAIDMYKNECEYHYQSLKWDRKDFFNKLILCFERSVSSYGTSAGMAISIFLLFNIIIFTFCLDYLMLFDNYVLKGVSTVADDFFKTLIPTISYSKNSIYSYAWLKVLHFVVNASLIYEIIKSFRKYSRKL
ncbi:pentapeptide repeat-containing protein [Francisellaceae bacterium CB300]